MTADPYIERVQRRVLDDAGHEDVPVEWTTITEPRWPMMPLSNSTPLYDALVMERLLAESARPSLWQRTPDWVIGVATLVLLLVLLALPLVLR